MFFTYAFVSSAKENVSTFKKKNKKKQQNKTNKTRSTSAVDPRHLKI